jgi:RNA polymerase sigma-70 factor (ECF subfamily)
VTRQEFDRFVSENGKEILRFCRMNAGGCAEGDDLYQDTMLTLWEQVDKLNKRDSLKSYALSVSILIWRNKRRKFAWRHRIAAFESYEKHLESGGFRMPGKKSEEPEQRLLQKEMTEIVQRQVQALPQKYRTVVYLYYSAGLKYKEIAECLHIPESTVKSRMRKAKSILKKKLAVIMPDGPEDEGCRQMEDS